MAGEAPLGYLSNAELALMVTNFVANNRTFLNNLTEWVHGEPDGGPNNDGHYILTDSSGQQHLVPSPAKLYADSVGYGVDIVEQFNDLVERITIEVTRVEQLFTDTVAYEDSLYQAQQHELMAKNYALDARVSQGMSFPSDFVAKSNFWTEGNGQIAPPEAAANNPLSGTFPLIAGLGVVYRTEANPESCNSFGPIGYVQGIPGTIITITGRVRAITDETGGALNTAVGVGILPMNGDFSLQEYVIGTGVPSHTVADGWQTVKHRFVVPPNAPAPIYRPTAFYNVGGNTPDPLHPSNDPQGNQQYEWNYLQIEVQRPGSIPVPLDYRDLYGGGTYQAPPGATYLKLFLRGGDGGTNGGGGLGQPGTPSTFGGWYASGGGPGQAGDIYQTIVPLYQAQATYTYQQGYGGYGGPPSTTTFQDKDDNTVSITVPGGDNARYGSIYVEAY